MNETQVLGVDARSIFEAKPGARTGSVVLRLQCMGGETVVRNASSGLDVEPAPVLKIRQVKGLEARDDADN